jgi:metallo-beta-lactamase class B
MYGRASECFPDTKRWRERAMLNPIARTLLGAALLVGSVSALANRDSMDVSKYPSQTSFPKENARAVAKHLSAARRLAEPDLMPELNWRCLFSPLDRPTVFAVQHNGLVPATRVFDQLYSVGQNAVSAWALDTSAGIIVIDALNSAEEAREILVPNLIHTGLDPHRIRYVIITHGHGDHNGGAKYLQETYRARVVAAEADWRMMESPPKDSPFASLLPPRRDIVASDGDVLTLGSTRVQMFVTPGHTPGVLSLIFPVTDKGVKHVVGFMGGTGGGQDAASIRQQIVSLTRWARLTKAAGADVPITNHATHMAANEKLALLRYAMAGDDNPFVYGRSRFQRMVGMLNECSRVQLARLGESAD